MKQRIIYILLIVGLFLMVAYIVSSTESQYLDTSSDSTYCELYQSMRDNDLEKLNTLLETNINLNRTGCQNNDLPLFFAVKYGVSKEYFTTLEEAGMSITRTNERKQSAIQYAYEKEITHLVEVMLENQFIDLDNEDSDGFKLIDYAMDKTDFETVDLLLEKGVVLEITDQTDIFNLYQARELDMVKTIISKGFNLYARNDDGLTLVEMAMKNNDFQTLHFLVNNGGDVYSEYNDETLFEFGMRNNDFKLVELLVSNGFDVNKEDMESPLFAAVEISNQAMLKFVLDAGATPNVANDENQLLSLFVTRANDLNIFDLLFEYGLDLNYKNAFGNTLLVDLFKDDSTPDLLPYLLEHGANLYSKNNFGKMPIHNWFESLNADTKGKLVNFITSNGIRLTSDALSISFIEEQIVNEPGKRLVYVELLRETGVKISDYITITEFIQTLGNKELLLNGNDKVMFEALSMNELNVFEGFVADMYLSFKIDGNSNAQTFELNQSYIDQLTSITSIENLYLGYIENDSPYKLSLMEYAVLSNRYDLIDLLISNDYSEADVTYVDNMFFNRKAIHHARDLAMINKLEELGYSISDTYDYRECSNGCKVYENISVLSNINMLGSDFDELLTYLGENEFDFMSQVNVYNNCTIAFECNETPSDFYTHLHSIIPEQLIPIEVVDTYVRKAVEYGFDVDLEDSKGNTIIDYLNERNEGEAGDQIIKTLIKEIKK